VTNDRLYAEATAAWRRQIEGLAATHAAGSQGEGLLRHLLLFGRLLRRVGVQVKADEMLDLLAALWSGQWTEHHGEFYDVASLKQCPAAPSRIPLLVGGHADAALRRAVRKGDGWMHAGGDGEELDRLLTRLAEIRAEEGDTRDDFEVHVISYDAYTLDGIKRLEDKGVTDCIVGFRVPYIKGPDTEPLEKKIEHLERYAEQIIAKL